MARNRKTLFIALWIVAALIACSACGRSTEHCYLCQGIPQDDPCIVNLATGDIAVLSAGGYGHAELSITGDVSVTGENGELCRATIPITGEQVNPALFCEDCWALIEATPNNGYVLADLKDLSNIQLYSELEMLACKIYEDNAIGKLTDARYAILDAQYEKEQTALSKEIATLEKSIADYGAKQKSADRFLALVDRYTSFDELTTTMINEFVEKIVVHERDRKGCVMTTQKVDIYFNFIGNFVPPDFAVQTPEEIKAMEEMEALRQKRHEAYLKRKASGAQKRYENKIKAQKKAEMDAKKDAIRREDIEKGVFTPVARLPKHEPQRAAASL